MTETRRTAAGKLVDLLEALADQDSESRDGLTVAQVARALSCDKSVASRQLKPLVELGLVERSNDGCHRLGWRLFSIAAQAGDQRLLLLAPPVMRRLTQLVGERVHLSLRRGVDVFTILSEGPHRTIEAREWVGHTAPLHNTSAGRALLFDHSERDIKELFADGFAHPPGPKAPRDVNDLVNRVVMARRQGFALVVDEFDEDLTAVAAPIRDVHGRVAAALNISAPSYRMTGHVQTTGRQLAQAAMHLTRALLSPPDTSS